MELDKRVDRLELFLRALVDLLRTSFPDDAATTTPSSITAPKLTSPTTITAPELTSPTVHSDAPKEDAPLTTIEATVTVTSETHIVTDPQANASLTEEETDANAVTDAPLTGDEAAINAQAKVVTDAPLIDNPETTVTATASDAPIDPQAKASLTVTDATITITEEETVTGIAASIDPQAKDSAPLTTITPEQTEEETDANAVTDAPLTGDEAAINVQADAPLTDNPAPTVTATASAISIAAPTSNQTESQGLVQTAHSTISKRKASPVRWTPEIGKRKRDKASVEERKKEKEKRKARIERFKK